MFKKIRHFFSEYRQLGLVLISAVAAGALDIAGNDKYAHIVLGTSALINVIPLIWGMIQDLRDGKYGVDILAATAIITSVVLGEYWAGMIIVLMLTGGEALEDYAESRAKRELTSLLHNRPRKAHLLKAGKLTDIAVKSIQVNDKLQILPGEVVPVDCIVIEGSSNLDESSLTGESLPVNKKVGDQLLSGSINVEGVLTVKALHTAKDSQYEQIIKLVKSAAAAQSPFVRLADRYSIPFTVISFLIAGTAWVVSGDPVRFLEVIVVATPCPLLLGAPIALISGMSRASKYGIIIKTGSALEKLAVIETVAFDKTGTLTYGEPSVERINTHKPYSQKEVLYFAASLEQGSHHILAAALVSEAKKRKVTLAKAKNVKEEAGLGISGGMSGKSILVGRAKFLELNGVKVSGKQNTTAVYLAVDGSYAGSITFVDEVRTESKSMLERLRRAGIRHTLMLTGDNENTAKRIAKTLGITDFQADCLPADKMRAIEKVEHKPVAFVGDGVNDAPVLTASDVGIALGARGSTAASESADVVIMLDDISKVADGVEISKRTFFIAKQSILIGIGMSLVLMVIFSTGRFKAAQGAAIQELIDITVIINALRAHGSLRSKKQGSAR